MSNHTEKSSRPASADYPVDPAERSHQEARLRKAAAAGASASKFPIPGLMLQRTASTTPEVQETQTTVSKPVTATDTVPGASQVPNGPVVTTEEVLVELRKISAWADLQRKTNKWSLIFLAGFVPVLVGAFVLMDRQANSKDESSPPPHQADWFDVDRNVRQGDFEKAIALGEELILKTPQYPEAQERLARAYLAAGNLEKAREHYAEAFRLFPSEANEKQLSAMEKRIKTEKP